MYLEIFARRNFHELPAELNFRVFIFANGDLTIYIVYKPMICINLKSNKMAASFGFASCVRGYHVCQEIWTATEGDTLLCPERHVAERTICCGRDSFVRLMPLHSLLANWHPWPK